MFAFDISTQFYKGISVTIPRVIFPYAPHISVGYYTARLRAITLGGTQDIRGTSPISIPIIVIKLIKDIWSRALIYCLGVKQTHTEALCLYKAWAISLVTNQPPEVTATKAGLRAFIHTASPAAWTAPNETRPQQKWTGVDGM